MKYLFSGILVGALTMMIAPTFTQEPRSSTITLNLPADYDTPVSATNNKNGVVVSYLTHEGELRMVQYSGPNYSIVHCFQFSEKS